MATVSEVLADALARLQAAAQFTAHTPGALAVDTSELRSEAQQLLRHALGNVNRAWLITHAQDALGGNIHAAFEGMLQRRLAGEPIAYILEQREFYGLPLKVSPATLIPRPDTETLVEAALQRLPLPLACHVLDLGTGSGAIALAVASQRPLVQVTAVDASVAALQVARANAAQLCLSNVQLLASDWFAALGGQRYQLILSNPPYIAECDPHLSRGDLKYEPRSALAAGSDGLDDIRRIICDAPAHLVPGGWLMLEHGYDQAAALASLLQHAGFNEVTHAYDLAGIARVSLGQWPA